MLKNLNFQAPAPFWTSPTRSTNGTTRGSFWEIRLREAAGDIASREAFGANKQFQDGLFSAIHFDYDSARIRPSEMPKLEAVAVRLKSNPEKLVVEGHCDERGTAEYNRALGERRAIAAREFLVNLGIDPNRITTVSYGEDRPAVMGGDNSVHSQNRRCEFVVVSQ